MPDIARLDEDGLLVAVETVADEEHGTDLAKRKIALPDGHDMQRHLKNYRWDVLRGHFIPKSMEPLAEAERETPELVEGLVEAIEDLYDKLGKRQQQGKAGAWRPAATTRLRSSCRPSPSGRSTSSGASFRVASRRPSRSAAIGWRRPRRASATTRRRPTVSGHPPQPIRKRAGRNRRGPRRMTQATDLGNIHNQLAQPYRQRVNTNLQAVVTQHYGATEPSPLYPNMLWFSSGDGYIKLRNPTNSGWQNVGTIGPPMKWTNVDIPSTGVEGRRHQGDAPRRGGGLVRPERRHDRRSLFRRHNPRQSGLLGGVRLSVGGVAGCRSTSPAPGRRSAVPATG